LSTLQQLEISTALVFKLLDRTVTGDGTGLDSSDSVWVPSFVKDNLGFPQKQHMGVVFINIRMHDFIVGTSFEVVGVLLKYSYEVFLYEFVSFAEVSLVFVCITHFYKTK